MKKDTSSSMMLLSLESIFKGVANGHLTTEKAMKLFCERNSGACYIPKKPQTKVDKINILFMSNCGIMEIVEKSQSPLYYVKRVLRQNNLI